MIVEAYVSLIEVECDGCVGGVMAAKEV